MKLRRILTLLLACALLVSVFPAAAAPREQTITYINPLYADVITEADLVQPVQVKPDAEPQATTNGSVEEAAAILREGMKNRAETVTVNVSYDGDYRNAINAVSDAAMAHTGVADEGDYIRWQFAGWKSSISISSIGINFTNYTITYTLTYYTTAEQETEMDTAVDNLLTELNVQSMSDYEAVRAIYDYICSNITYDHDNLENEDYTLKYTAYAALMNKTAVCQGYANLFYRLALECGVDARLISGIGNGGGHGWNIVELDGLYYDLDATWDAGRTSWSYFLRCDANFGDHTRDEEYCTNDFYAAYPMSTVDYADRPTDLDGDGQWDTSDLNLLSRYLTGSVTLTDSQKIAADLNHDGSITSADAVLLAKKLLTK